MNEAWTRHEQALIDAPSESNKPPKVPEITTNPKVARAREWL
jgi:hypothetical protein